MKNTNIQKNALILLFLITLTFTTVACSPDKMFTNNEQKTGTQPNEQNSQEEITIGMQVGPASTLLMVAEERGFFQKNEVNVKLVEFTAGKFALQAFLAGSFDMAASGEVPVMYSSLRGEEYYIITQVVEQTINEVRVIARKDADKDKDTIHPKEYFSKKKRKLATSFGGGPEFFTYNFLKKNSIPQKQVELISQKPEDMPAALASGSVDAIAIFDPFAYIAEQQLREKSIIFTDDTYSELYILSGRKDWVVQNKEQVKKILQALVDAGEFIKKNPEEAKEILLKRTTLSKKTIDGIWNNFVYKPSLNPLLPGYLYAQAAWAKETNKVPSNTQVPDYSEYIYTEPLKEIRPEDVTI